MINRMRILVRLVLNREFLEIISRCCAILFAVGCMWERRHDNMRSAQETRAHESWVLYVCVYTYVCVYVYVCETRDKRKETRNTGQSQATRAHESWVLYVCEYTYMCVYICVCEKRDQRKETRKMGHETISRDTSHEFCMYVCIHVCNIHICTARDKVRVCVYIYVK